MVLGRLNGQSDDPFKLTRSICQGCSLVRFFYISVANFLGYLLEEENAVKGLKPPSNFGQVIDQEYADDTNFYVEGTLQNLNNTKRALGVIALTLGAKIN